MTQMTRTGEVNGRFLQLPARKSKRCMRLLTWAMLLLCLSMSARAGVTSLQQGSIGYSRGDYDNALMDFQKAVQASTNDSKAYNNLGLTYMRLARYPEATAAFDQAKALSTNVYIAPFLNKAKSLCRQGMFSEAFVEVTAGLTITNSDTLLYQKAWIQDELGQSSSALISLNAALSANPSNYLAFALRGFVEAKLGQSTSAIADFYSTINGKPGDIVATMAAYNLQRLRCVSNLAFQSQSAADSFTNGLYWMRLERFADADTAFSQAQALDPSLPDIPYGLALCRIQAGNTAGASNAMQSAQSNMVPITVDRFNSDFYCQGDVYIDGIMRGTGPVTIYLFPSLCDLTVRANQGGLLMEWHGPIYTDGTPGGATNIVVNPVGLSNYTAFGPVADTDRDWLADNWEIAKLGGLGYGPQDDPYITGLSNLRKFWYSCNPIVTDSDGDGTSDPVEINAGTDPSRYTRRYYVDVARPDDSGDGLSWGTAKRTIQGGVDCATPVSSANDTAVMVAAGTYSSGTQNTLHGLSRVVVTKNIVLRGASGVSQTIIEGSGTNQVAITNAIRCVQMTAGVLCGLTLQNGCGAYGGGVLIYGGSVRSCTIQKNYTFATYVGHGGGGVCMEAGFLQDCRIVENVGNFGEGAGVQVLGGRIRNCTITGNSGSDKGAGLWVSSGRVENCTISSNAACQYGTVGGVYVGVGGLLSKCTVSANNGGGVFAGGGGSVQDSLICGNYNSILASPGSGVALTIGSSALRCTSRNNNAVGVWMANGNGRVEDCFIYGNTGGGLFTACGVVSRCNIESNSGVYGGVDLSIGGYPRVSKCRISRNSGSVVGGVYAGAPYGESALVVDCLIDGNSGGAVGGAKISNFGSMQNCTITGNAGVTVGGVQTFSAINPVLNCISYYNTNGDAVGLFSGSCLGTNIGGNNITNLPQFIVLGSGYGTNYIAGDYRLQATSPCIDAGSTQGRAVAAFDLAGSPRISPQGGRLDMGAYEFQTTNILRLIDLSGSLAFGNVVTGQTATSTMTVTNSGNSLLTVTNITYPTGFSGVPTLTVAAKDATSVTVRFAPTAIQSYSGAITVLSDATSGTSTINCSGTGIAPTRVVGLLGNLAFGNVVTGQTATSTMTVTNSGNSLLTVTSITYPPCFTGAWNGVLAAGKATNVTVTFAPTAIQSYSGAITVFSDATSGTSAIGCTGTGTAYLTLADAVDCMSQVWTTGGFSTWFSETTNTHDGVDAAQSGILTDSKTNWIQTSVSGPGTLTYWWKVSSEVNYDWLTFYVDGVAQAGRISGSVSWGAMTKTVTGDGLHTLRWEYSKDVNQFAGSDAAWLDEVVWTPAAPTRIVGLLGNLMFGNVATGQVATSTMTVTNSGNSLLTVTNITYPPCFSGAWTGTLAAGKATNVTVRFAPTAIQSYSGAITVFSDATSGTSTINCSGTGGGAPTRVVGLLGNLAFGNVVTGQTATSTMTVTNSGNALLTVTNITYPPCFSGAWTGTVAAGRATNVTVRFAPTAIQSYSGAITVFSDATSGTNTISCSGTGFRVLFTVPTGISLPGVWFGSVAWGDYDNDGYLDILLTGSSSGGKISKVYRNNGNGTFTEQTGIVLAGVAFSSVAWGDYDNDGYLDILLTGNTGSSYVSKVYRNNGNGTFTEQTGIVLAGVAFSSVAWGDYDNDGYLDILLTGSSSGGKISKVYRNNGNGTFTLQTNIVLTGVEFSSVAWGDYDNDGYLDILLSGYLSGYTGVTKVYRNNGNGTFTERTNIVLTGVGASSIAWGDYDNDGYLDILLTGNTGSSYVSKVYRNNGNGTFTDQTNIVLTGIRDSSAAWGDYDNDGLMDILLVGDTGSGRISKVYRNNGDGTFTEHNEAGLVGLQKPSVAWGDYDNDGDLDVLVTGYSSSSVSRIYRNEASQANTPPTAPPGLSATTVSNGVVRVSWGATTDGQTPSTGLSYNTRVGTAPGLADVSPGMANVTNGWRRLPAMGNANKSLSWNLKGLNPSNTYYVSVQAVDTAFAGGSWAVETNFTPQIMVTTHGTPHSWLDLHVLVSGGNYEAADLADVDGDGMAAWQEYVAGTVPTNKNSTFYVSIKHPGNQMMVHWSPDLTGAVPARVYSVYGTPLLRNGFPIAPLTNIPAGTPVTVPSFATNRFFKVGVAIP